MPPKRVPARSASASSSSSHDTEEGDIFTDSAPSPNPLQEHPEAETTNPSTQVNNAERPCSNPPPAETNGLSNKIITQCHSSSNSESSASKSEPDSDSDIGILPLRPNTRSSYPTVRPISSKPMVTKDTVNPKTNKRTPAKRPSEPGDSVEETPKKQPFKRLWSEDDEVRILKGVLEFSKKVDDPFEDHARLYNFVKQSTHRRCSKTQLMDKIRRLRQKYEAVVSKSANKGKYPKFLNGHGRVIYGLSSKIWNKDEMLVSAKEKNFDGSDNNHSVSGVSVLLDKLVGDTTIAQGSEVDNGPRVCMAMELGKKLLGASMLDGGICNALINRAFAPCANEQVEEICNELLVIEMEHQIKRANLCNRLLQMMASQFQGGNANA